MNYEERKPLLAKIEELRGRTLISFFNFDRLSEPKIPGLHTAFSSDTKESLFRVLKESDPSRGIDLFLYTRGGDTNSVWPTVNLVREFDKDFQVIAPFRCHSSGTLVALGAAKIVLGPISELSPIDPSTGNQFNPEDPLQPGQRRAISVEDVSAYANFVKEQFKDAGASDTATGKIPPDYIRPFIERLTIDVHPLALGNVQRVLLQSKQLAQKLLSLHPQNEEENTIEIIDALTTKFRSHLHMIDRNEAKEILGNRIVFADDALAAAMDQLLRVYEDSFAMRKTFFMNAAIRDSPEFPARFIGGVIESTAWSYLFETQAVIRQRVQLPPNVQVQLPPGQSMPLIPGLPRAVELDITTQGWVHNTEPKGVTL
jgi:hypothetical protein